MIRLLVASVLCVLSSGCLGNKNKDENPLDTLKQDKYLIFQSGFEDNTRVVPYGKVNDKIVGSEENLKKSNWKANLDGTINKVYINYTQGDSTLRRAEIVADPVDATNRVLHYWIKEPWQTGQEEKARVQIEFHEIQRGLKEFVQSTKVYFPDDMKALRHYPDKLTWFTLVEIWNEVAWRPEIKYGGRVTFGIAKPNEGEGDFYFKVDAQDHDPTRLPEYPYETLWMEINKNIRVPFGEWFTLEYYLKEGDAENGRFYMTIQREGMEKQVLFDITNYTHNPANPVPDGVTEFNPLKLYTSKKTAEYMKQNNKRLEVYWDDLKLWGVY